MIALNECFGWLADYSYLETCFGEVPICQNSLRLIADIELCSFNLRGEIVLRIPLIAARMRDCIEGALGLKRYCTADAYVRNQSITKAETSSLSKSYAAILSARSWIA